MNQAKFICPEWPQRELLGKKIVLNLPVVLLNIIIFETVGCCKKRTQIIFPTPSPPLTESPNAPTVAQMPLAQMGRLEKGENTF